MKSLFLGFAFLFLLFISSTFVFAEESPNLRLFTPKFDGKVVEQNGIVKPICKDLDLDWCKKTNPLAEGTGPFEFVWGDGNVSCSWFPAKHDYTDFNNYTLGVRVKNTCELISEKSFLIGAEGSSDNISEFAVLKNYSSSYDLSMSFWKKFKWWFGKLFDIFH